MTAVTAKYRQIADELRDQIRRGALKPADPLPSEEVLAAQHGVTRPTVRSAVAQLREEGLVYTVNGRGSFVRTPEALRRLAAALHQMADAMDKPTP